MGEVYKARHTRLGRDVAIKVLPADFTTDSNRLRRFEQEARTVGGLNHANLVTLRRRQCRRSHLPDHGVARGPDTARAKISSTAISNRRTSSSLRRRSRAGDKDPSIVPIMPLPCGAVWTPCMSGHTSVLAAGYLSTGRGRERQPAHAATHEDRDRFPQSRGARSPKDHRTLNAVYELNGARATSPRWFHGNRGPSARRTRTMQAVWVGDVLECLRRRDRNARLGDVLRRTVERPGSVPGRGEERLVEHARNAGPGHVEAGRSSLLSTRHPSPKAPAGGSTRPRLRARRTSSTATPSARPATSKDNRHPALRSRIECGARFHSWARATERRTR